MAVNTKIACVIMSFDRPDYLRKSLEAIKHSIEYTNKSVHVYLFQDGAYNIFSNTQRSTDLKIQKCISIFKKIFMSGEVLASPNNIGVCLNFDRAEKFLFEKCDYTAAMFFEDDMVVHQKYIQTILSMLDQAVISDRIGNMAAYGANHLLPRARQIVDRDRIDVLNHSWGFGLTRKAYFGRKSYMHAYHNVLRNIDYVDKDRHADQIHEIHLKMGFPPHVISQDMMKIMANHKAGLVNINTVAVLGKYIGENGVHSNSEFYEASGFGSTDMYPATGDTPNINILEDYVLNDLYTRQEYFIRNSSPLVNI